MKREEWLRGRSAVIVLTDQGLATGERIVRCFCESNISSERPELWVHQKCQTSIAVQPKEDRASRTFERMADILPELWQESDVLIFVMATGIVVRQIASLIQSKDRDPAVLVLDEKGQFVISLLSGHLGGANAWAKTLAHQLKAQPVITTATDVQGLTAPDEYARRLGWTVKPISSLKRVNRCLLDTGCLKVWSAVSLAPEHPLKKDEHYRFVNEDEKEDAQIWVTPFQKNEDDLPWIILIPKTLSIGVGCRRGIGKEKILEAIQGSLSIIGASEESISGMFSIDIKQQEAGMIEAAHEMSIPFQTFSAVAIQTMVDQQELSQSEFVKEKIGVDGVCEAASLLGTKHGKLILSKQKWDGVTVAISMERFLL